MDKLLTDKFEVLKKCFSCVSLEDLYVLSEEDLLALVDSKNEQLLMKIFVRTRLHPFMKKETTNEQGRGHFEYFNVKPTISVDPIFPQIKNGKLDLSGIICSKMMGGIVPGKWTIEEFMKKDEFEKMEKSAVNRIELIACPLVDQDMENVCTLVSNFPQCRVVDLSDNRLHGFKDVTRSTLDNSIMKLLDAKIRVVLIGNPFSTIDRKDFFQNLDAKFLFYLIFIAPYWLDAHGWNALIQDRKDFAELSKKIVDGHKLYFQFLS